MIVSKNKKNILYKEDFILYLPIITIYMIKKGNKYE